MTRLQHEDGGEAAVGRELNQFRLHNLSECNGLSPKLRLRQRRRKLCRISPGDCRA
jgi:hypothetical protein